jgi:hypothetical protein
MAEALPEEEEEEAAAADGSFRREPDPPHEAGFAGAGPGALSGVMPSFRHSLMLISLRLASRSGSLS